MTNVNSDADPRMNQRDPSKEWNQLRPTSLRSSGTELDPCCGDITQSPAGLGLDKALRAIDQQPLKSRNEVLAEAGTNTPPPMVTAEGNQEARKLGAGLSSWKDTQIGQATHPMEIDPIFRR